MVGLQKRNEVVRLRHDLNRDGPSVRLKGADLHGVAQHGKRLAVVCSASDSVFDLTLSTTVFQNDGCEVDRLHINDLCVWRGELLACRFGADEADQVRSGEVFRVDDGAVLLRGLRQPHSLVGDDDLWLLESLTGCLVRWSGPGEIPVAVRQFAGYARGLAISGHRAVVG